MKSFYYAFSGIASAFKSERNLRIHFAVANLIVVFAAVYGISRTEWAILILDIASVFSAELVNTGIESAVDTATSEKKDSARLAKDAAAGGVLVLAMASVAVGICLFGNLEGIWAALVRVFTTPGLLVLFIILGAIDIKLVFGGKNVK